MPLPSFFLCRFLLQDWVIASSSLSTVEHCGVLGAWEIRVCSVQNWGVGDFFLHLLINFQSRLSVVASDIWRYCGNTLSSKLCVLNIVVFVYVDAKYNPGASGWWKCWRDLQQVQCHQGKFQNLLILCGKISWYNSARRQNWFNGWPFYI